jgi:N-acyl-D-amino-acid deacylase
MLAPLAVAASARADFVDWRTTIPITYARESASFRPFDVQMTSFMAARNIPGGALAVSRNGKLVFAAGYGYADVNAKEPVTPTSLFRIASVTKPITGVAMMRLMELYPDRVSLDTPAFPLVKIEPWVEEGKTPDPRLQQITVGELLHHTAGWDRGKSFDPMGRTLQIAEALGIPSPAGARDIVRYMLGQPLEFDPGAEHVYSNFGYCVLGRIIEDVSGKSYEQFVKDEVLTPLGITRMRIGHSLPEDRATGEVCYYDPHLSRSVWHPDSPEKAPNPYAFSIEAMDSHGGWIASAVDLVKFACAFGDPEHCPILKPESVAAMFARPEGPAGYNEDGTPKDAYYACGWSVRPTGDGKANHWHNGGLPGTSTLLVRRSDGLNWAVLFNQSTDDSGLDYGDIDPAMHRAANAVKDWPEWDLWEVTGDG